MTILASLYQHRHLIIGLIGGIVLAAWHAPLLWRVWVAFRSQRNSPTRRISLSVPFAACSSIAPGALLVTHLDENMLPATVAGLLLAAIALGWVLVFQNDAFRFDSPLRIFGSGQASPAGFVRPLHASITLICLMFIAGLLGGACVRLIYLASHT